MMAISQVALIDEKLATFSQKNAPEFSGAFFLAMGKLGRMDR